MEISSLTGANASTSQGAENALRDVDLDDFLKLMITELRNQDPLNPMDNVQILQTVSQIREIGATAKLNETLDAVLLGQNLTNAASLIGKQIRALTSDGDSVSGRVDRVTIAGGDVSLHVGELAVPLNNVSEILPPDEDQ